MAAMNQSTAPPSANHQAAANIRAELARHSRRATHLAELLGISRQAAARKLAGSTAITVDELDSIARWLFTTPAKLLEGSTD